MSLKIFDTHAHYTDAKYDVDRESLFKKMYIEGVDKITLIGPNFDESKAEKALAYKYNGMSNMPHFYYTIGDHPDEIINELPESDVGVKHLGEMEALCKDNGENVSAVAIGEVGLDYFGDFKIADTYNHQKEWFIAYINLAKKLNLPIVVHSRDACEDTMKILKEYGKGLNGIIHCFSYEKEIALEYIKMGFHIGIGGVVTFKNARKLKEVAKEIPIESIVTETDCPWMAPTPHRGERNESTYIKFVIEEIGKIRNVDLESLSGILYNNAMQVYNLI